MLKKMQESVRWIRTHVEDEPEVGIVLGTGLGGLSREIEERISIPYNQIPHFPRSTVEGHAGQLIFGTLSGRRIVAMNGRFHFYEGYSLDEITFPVLVMRELGIRLLILSNASGGLNPGFAVGDMMFVVDHINLMTVMNANRMTLPDNGKPAYEWLDMSRPVDLDILAKAEAAAHKLGITYQKGVYAGVTGPAFETPSEYKYVRWLGADAVGMSTVPEIIVARRLNLPVLAISVISDLGIEGKIVEISHEDVIDAASLAEPKMTAVIKELLQNL